MTDDETITPAERAVLDALRDDLVALAREPMPFVNYVVRRDELMRVAEQRLRDVRPWPGYTPEAQAYELRTRDWRRFREAYIPGGE